MAHEITNYFVEYAGFIKLRAKDKRSTNRKFVQEYKHGKSCDDCKIEYPGHIMQYDHVSGEKICNLNSMYRTHSMDAILEEIAKCDIVCANCHSHRTWMRSLAGYKVG